MSVFLIIPLIALEDKSVDSTAESTASSDFKSGSCFIIFTISESFKSVFFCNLLRNSPIGICGLFLISSIAAFTALIDASFSDSLSSNAD